MKAAPEAKLYSQPPVVLHVGAAKAASTFLQSECFSKNKEIFYLGKYGGSERINNLFWSIQNTDNENFSFSWAKDFYNKLIEENKRELPIVLSHEGFTGIGAVSTKERIERARAIFGDCEILYVTRNQYDAAKSWYVFAKNYHDFPNIDEWIAANAYAPYLERHEAFQRMDFYAVASLLRTYFRPEKVNIVPYESLKNDQELFLKDISSLIGAPMKNPMTSKPQSKYINATYGSIRYWRWRQFRKRYFSNIRLSRFVPEALHAAAIQWMRSGVKVELGDRGRHAIGALYAAGNARLAEEFGVPLRQFGYPTESE